MQKKILKKKSHNAGKNERGPLGFFNIHSVAKLQKNEGRTLWGYFFEKDVTQCRKNSKVGPFSLARY